MRYRVKDERYSYDTANASGVGGCGAGGPVAYSNDYSFGGAYGGKIIETWDVETPNYFRRRKNGEIIVNPYVHKEVTVYPQQGGYGVTQSCPPPITTVQTANWSGYVADWLAYNGMILGQTPSAIISQEAIDDGIKIAATSAWSNVRRSDAQLLVFAAETHKTVQLLLHPLGNLMKFLRKVKSIKDADPDFIKRQLTVAQYIATEWLTFRYGWLQLQRDVENVAKAIGRDKRNGVQTGRGSFQIQETRTTTSVNHPATGNGKLNYHSEALDVDHVVIKAGLLHHAELSLADYLGVTPRDLLDTIWEVIPFSFVVDWLVNVQDYVRSLYPLFGGVPIGGGYTVVTRTLTRYRTVPLIDVYQQPSGGAVLTVTQQLGGTGVTVIRKKERIAGIVQPGLHFSPKIGNLGDKRVADLCALIVQRLRSR